MSNNQIQRLLNLAQTLQKRGHHGAASVFRFRARRAASAAIMAPPPAPPARTAEQALADLREVM